MVFFCFKKGVVGGGEGGPAAMTETQLSQSGGESEDDQSLFAVEEAVD